MRAPHSFGLVGFAGATPVDACGAYWSCPSGDAYNATVIGLMEGAGWNPMKALRKAASSVSNALGNAAKVVAKLPAKAAANVRELTSSAYNLAAGAAIPFQTAVSAAIQCGVAAYNGSKKAARAIVATYNAIKEVGAQAAALYSLAKSSFSRALAPALAKLAEAAKITTSILPYVQAAIACVPVVGQGVSAALGAAAALAQGKSITQAMIDAAAGLVPGGAIATAAVRVGAALCSGERLDAALLSEVRRVLPPAVGSALDVGIALGTGRATQAGQLLISASVQVSA